MTRRQWATLGFLMLAATQVGCDDDCLDERDAMQAFLTDASHLTCKGRARCAGSCRMPSPFSFGHRPSKSWFHG